MSGGRSTLKRAHSVLLHIADGGGDASLRSIATALDMPQSSAHRILGQLVEDGLVTLDAAGRYRLGWQALYLARRIWGGASEDSLAVPLMRELSAETGETITLNRYLPDQGMSVCVAVVETPQRLSYALDVGDTRNLNMGAGGKSILAALPPEDVQSIIERHGLPMATERSVTDRAQLDTDLDLIRRQGFAISRGESVAGAIGFAAPVFFNTDRVFGSIAITAPELRFDPANHDIWAVSLKAKAAMLSEVLGASAPTITQFFDQQ